MQGVRNAALLLEAMLAGVLLPGVVMGATPGEIIQKRQQLQIEQDDSRVQRVLPPGGADLDKTAPEAGTGGPRAAQCYQIEHIELGGAEHLGAGMRRRIEAEFAGSCLGVAQITRILSLITFDYVRQGYVTTRAYLPAQDLHQGTLRIQIIEGIISSVRIDGNGSHASTLTAFPGLTGRILNLRDLEQGIDQLNRLSSNHARLDIRPGAKAGESDVVVRNEAQFPLHVFTSYDNQGASSSGQHAVSGTLLEDGLLGLNEALSYTHRQSVEHPDHYSEQNSVALSIPYGYYMLSMNASRSRYFNRVQLPSGASAPLEGSSQSTSVSLDRVLYRDQSSRFDMSAGLSSGQSRNYFAQQFLIVSSRNLTVLNLRANYSAFLSGASVSASLGYDQGLKAFGAMRDADDAGPDQPRAQFRKLLANVSLTYPFRVAGQTFSYGGQLSVQHAYTPLFGSEQMLIGGAWSVRGFYDNSLTGDSGYTLRNELSWHLPDIVRSHARTTRLYGAFDSGYVKNLSDRESGGSLTGATGGLRMDWKHLSLDLYRSYPLSKPASMQRESAQTWFRLSAYI